MPSPLLINSTFLLKFFRATTIVTIRMVVARFARRSSLERLVSGF